MDDEQLLRRVAANIKRRRKQLRLRQSDMQQFGFSLRRYQDIESGRANLTLKAMLKIANALEVPITALYTDEQAPIQQLIYDKLLDLSMLTYVVMDYTDPSDKLSLVLYEYNNVMQKSAPFDLRGKIGQRIVDLYPSARTTGLIDFYYSIYTTGQDKVFDNVIYRDDAHPLVAVCIYGIRGDDNRIHILVKNVTEQVLKYQEQRKGELVVQNLSNEVASLKQELEIYRRINLENRLR